MGEYSVFEELLDAVLHTSSHDLDQESESMNVKHIE